MGLDSQGQLGLPGYLGQWDRPVIRDLPESKVLRVRRAVLVRRVRPVHQVMWDQPELREQSDLRVRPERRETPVLQVVLAPRV